MSKPIARVLKRAALSVAFGISALAPAFAAPLSEVSAARSGGPRLSTNIYKELADEVTQKMLASESFKRILADKDQPRLVVGKVQNRTEDETIDTVYIGRQVSEVVIESGLVRWFEFGTNDFDLVASPSLSGIYLGEGRKREYRFTLTLTLSDLLGEIKGRWTAEKVYQKK